MVYNSSFTQSITTSKLRCGEERDMALPNRMSLHPGLLWLTLNLALIIRCLSRTFFFNFTFPLRSFRLIPGVRVPHVEDRCSIKYGIISVSQPYRPPRSVTVLTLLYFSYTVYCGTNGKLRHCATNRKVVGSKPGEVIFFNLPNPSCRTGVYSASNKNEHQKEKNNVSVE
jgi:hypothetical protein